jgi:hypothetical protein
MAARKRSRKRAGLLWRVPFGYNGPTKAALKKSFGKKKRPAAKQAPRRRSA